MDGDSSQQSPGASGSWQFKPGDTVGVSPTPEQPQSSTFPANMPAPEDYAHVPASAPKPHEDSVTWSASEFIAHQKSFSWYAILGLATVVVAALIFLLTKDKISTAAVVVVAIVLGVAAARKPRTLPYKVDGSGLTIGAKFYDYGQFRSFAVVDEDAFSSVIFMPLKRFRPLITIYYEPPDENKIVGVLSNRLPMETHQLDMIEQFMRKIRF